MNEYKCSWCGKVLKYRNDKYCMVCKNRSCKMYMRCQEDK